MPNEPAQSITAAQTATTFDQLLVAARGLATAAASEMSTIKPALEAEGPRWAATAAATTELSQKFNSDVSELLGGWTSKRESTIFQGTSDATSTALASSAAAIGESAPVGSAESHGTIEQMCLGLAKFIEMSNTRAAETVIKVEEAQKAFLQAYPGGNVTYFPVTGTTNTAPSTQPATAQELAAVEAVRPDVLWAGQMLHSQNTNYAEVGAYILGAAQALKWAGTTGNSASPSGPTSASPASVPPGGGPTDAGPEQPGGTGGEQAGGAAGEQAGADPGAGQGGTGLAGTPALPTTPAPTVPGTGLTPHSPPAGVPWTPVGAVPSRGIPSTGTRVPAGGFRGGGGISGVGGIGRAGGLDKAGIGKIDPAIPSAAKVPTQTSMTNGQAPSLSSTGGAAASGAQGAGGVPPMMPPMGGAGAAAGGGGGKPGSGAIRPTGRERKRSDGPTPGVPAGLQGKTGKPGAFQPAVASQRREREQVETLQVLDEELWTVDGADQVPAAAAAPRQRRLAR
ncbi:hypothetical protein AB0F43_10430 [Kribbella sp. NPDC023972]|uniref:hypothetical protein n=1 Tax=Kribbella sp. NPDC023972 TaxID=3154795 RepID=UPI0033D06BB5